VRVNVGVDLRIAMTRQRKHQHTQRAEDSHRQQRVAYLAYQVFIFGKLLLYLESEKFRFENNIEEQEGHTRKYKIADQVSPKAREKLFAELIHGHTLVLLQSYLKI
jgi:hypothetical protein